MSNMDVKAINTIRGLAADTVQKANSGHPGLPLGAAAMAFELAAYGFFSGFLFSRARWQCIRSLCRCLIVTMLAGGLLEIVRINGGLNFAERVCDLLPRGIRHVLPDNFEIRRNAKHQPAAIRVQECACRLHATMKLAGSLLQLQRARFILSYQLLNFINGHTAKRHLLDAMIL